MHSLDNQIAFVDELIGFSSSKTERSLLEAIKVSLKELRMSIEPVKKPESGLYQKFVNAYFDFRIKRGAKARWSGRSGDTMKEVIKYLKELPKAQGSEEKALMFWKYILDNWDKLTPYLQGRVQIGQINDSLEEILDRLKNHHHGKTDKRNTETTHAQPGRRFGKL